MPTYTDPVFVIYSLSIHSFVLPLPAVLTPSVHQVIGPGPGL